MKKILLVLLLLLGACQTAIKFPEQADMDEVPNLPPTYKQRAIAFEKALIDLPRGQTYIVYPYWRWSFDTLSVGFMDLCNATSQHRFSNSVEDWAMGEKKFGDWQSDVAEFVNSPLKNMGYDVVEASQSTFYRQREKRRAELLLSAKITDVKSNQCHLFNAFYLKDSDLIGGDAYIEVEWEVYDTLADKVIARFTTTGKGSVDKPTEKGNELILLRALSDAADRLGHEKGFYKLITQQDVLDNLIEAEENQSVISLNTSLKQQTKPINENYTLIKRATVTVDDNGTGFYITPSGHILTSAETVGSARVVAIEDSQGARYQAKVLRSNLRLNVALLKANLQNNYYLAIAPEEMQKPLTNVYTVGNPDEFKAHSTITQGIVSSWRFKKKKDQSFIQASITTTSGYAGAPLLDEFGNVLGIHDGRNTNETNFSYFVPIYDALRALNIKLKSL